MVQAACSDAASTSSPANHKNVEFYHKFKSADGGERIGAGCFRIVPTISTAKHESSLHAGWVRAFIRL
ncbi:hypothetical protein HMPREF9098_0370 [Kingella denitrificans ATCC 33394]|uniref:Uncharacterized protein n=1 Tax=Kingella denitrificans ATCC 33394 TaxID=888741 RepID=F0EWZ0_9NEIS|nr:hypothetical protein HMPREF9098_0370 [Kingella denitrificans ATCC 33394]